MIRSNWETPEGLLQVANLHLGLAERERHWQMERLLSHRLFRPAEATVREKKSRALLP